MPLRFCICALNFPIGDTAEASRRAARSLLRSQPPGKRKSLVGHCPSVLEYQGSTADPSRWTASWLLCGRPKGFRFRRRSRLILSLAFRRTLRPESNFPGASHPGTPHERPRVLGPDRSTTMTADYQRVLISHGTGQFRYGVGRATALKTSLLSNGLLESWQTMPKQATHRRANPRRSLTLPDSVGNQPHPRWSSLRPTGR
jgi:hypothetical protein